MNKLSLIVVFLISFHFNSAANNPDSLKIIAKIDSAFAYKTTNIDTSLLLVKRAYALAEQSNKKFLMAKAENSIAIIYEYANQSDSALHHFQHANNILVQLLNKQPNYITAFELTCNYNDIAELHANINNLDKALEYNIKSIEINEKYSIKTRSINSFITRGKLAYLKQDTHMAKIYWEKGLNISDSLNNDDLTARLLNNLGSVYYYEQDWAKCLEYFRQAYLLQKSIKNETEIVKAANNVALVYFMLKQYKKALVYFTEADTLGAKHSIMKSQGMTLYYLIQTYMYLNNPEKMQDAFIRFQTVLDEQYNQEKAERINEIEVKYDVERKNQEIAMLEQQKLIDELTIQRRNRLILIVVFVILIIAVVIWYRFQNYKKQQTINKQNLEYQKVLTEQKMLRSQMNPHFIFNSLNSIQSFISSDQSYEAEKYLARFAKLMRGILENSRDDFVLLEKEIEVLKLYLDLEQLRFENRFSYTFKIDENIEPDFVSLPPMLIQPFIENAILHGLKSVNNGIISISFKEENDYLICEIDDNGVGRNSVDKSTEGKKHKSLATTITTERLQTLSEQCKRKAYFNIVDKTNEASGTKVIIHIPIIDD